MVFSHRMVLRFLVLLTAVPLVMTGCFGKQQDTKAPVNEEKLGIIDMNKAVKEHPRYNEYQTLQLQINAISYQLDAKKELPAPNVLGNQPSEFAENQTASGLDKNSQIEKGAKLSKKWNELDEKYQKTQLAIKQKAQAELADYSKELEKEYMMPLFNLKLKLNASLSQSEAEKIQAQVEKLETEKKQKYAARAAAVESTMNQAAAVEYERMQAELSAYQGEMNKEGPAPVADNQSGNLLPKEADSTDQVKLTQQLTALQQKQAMLEQQIIEDIQNKTGQIAAEKGLDTVITNIKVNIRAIDITDLVIAGLKK